MHYPNKTRLEVLLTPVEEVEKILLAIKEKNYQTILPLTAIQRQILAFNMSFGSNSDLPSLNDMLPPWARLEELEAKKPPYSSALVGSFEYGLEKNFISNAHFSSLDSKKLQASGWNPNYKSALPEKDDKKKPKRKR